MKDLLIRGEVSSSRSSNTNGDDDPLDAGGEKWPRALPTRLLRDGLLRRRPSKETGMSSCSSMQLDLRHDADLQTTCAGRASGPDDGNKDRLEVGASGDTINGSEQRRGRRRSMVVIRRNWLSFRAHGFFFPPGAVHCDAARSRSSSGS